MVWPTSRTQGCAGPFAPWGRHSGILGNDPIHPVEHGQSLQGEDKGKGHTPLGRHPTETRAWQTAFPIPALQGSSMAGCGIRQPAPAALCLSSRGPAPPRTLLLQDAKQLGSAARVFGHGCPGAFGARCCGPSPMPQADTTVIRQGRAVELPRLCHGATSYCKY